MYTTFEITKAMTVLAKDERRGEEFWRAADTVEWAEKNLSLAEKQSIHRHAKVMMRDG